MAPSFWALGTLLCPKAPKVELQEGRGLVDAASPPQHQANASSHSTDTWQCTQPSTKPLWQGWEMSFQPLTIAPQLGPDSNHPGPSWAELQLTDNSLVPTPAAPQLPREEGQALNPAIQGGKQRLKSGMTTATSNTRQVLCWDPIPVYTPSRENTMSNMSKWGPGRTTSARDENIFPNSPYSPQKKAIP